TVDVLPVADVLQVAARVLSAELGLRAVRLQPGVSVSAELRAGGHAAGGRVPHGDGTCGQASSRNPNPNPLPFGGAVVAAVTTHPSGGRTEGRWRKGRDTTRSPTQPHQLLFSDLARSRRAILANREKQNK
ncbi:hypothetical protein AOLI_G00053560, partial [Acnodon oligacanthus]